MITHARIFERGYEMDIPDEPNMPSQRRESYQNGEIVYDVCGLKKIMYRGREVWVKELELTTWDISF